MFFSPTMLEALACVPRAACVLRRLEASVGRVGRRLGLGGGVKGGEAEAAAVGDANVDGAGGRERRVDAVSKRLEAERVAGVKIAEVSITMGWEVMMTQFAAGGIGFLWGAIAFLLFLGIQVFAIALGLLSPSIHAARLHFVEWMGKFHNGSGAPFSPVGGRSIHVEGA